MKLIAGCVVSAVVVVASTIALAGVQPVLKNDDSKSYKYEIICTGASTSSSIDANAQITLSLPSMSGCKLKVAGAGTSKLTDGMRCVIKDSSLDCN